jgi:hypothetical protein
VTWEGWDLPPSSHLAQAPEGALVQYGDVVLVKVDVIELPELPEGDGGHVRQLVVGEHQVVEGAGEGGEAVWLQRLQAWGRTSLASCCMVVLRLRLPPVRANKTAV